jgi:hypothetical protein
MNFWTVDMRTLRTQADVVRLLEQIRSSEPWAGNWIVEQGEWDAFWGDSCAVRAVADPNRGALCAGDAGNAGVLDLSPGSRIP